MRKPIGYRRMPAEQRKTEPYCKSGLPVTRECACGCGEYVKPNRYWSQLSRFIKNHESHPDAYLGSADFLERFWSQVRSTGANGCWEWTGRRDDRKGQGYGVITLHSRVTHKSRPARAHRVAYELMFAVELASEDLGCHRCDNPPCCNPGHLFIGTQKENLRDSLEKGRHHNANRTHCRRGHPLTPDNLCADKRVGVRKCRTCTRRLAMKNYHLRRGEHEKAAQWA